MTTADIVVFVFISLLCMIALVCIIYIDNKIITDLAKENDRLNRKIKAIKGN